MRCFNCEEPMVKTDESTKDVTYYECSPCDTTGAYNHITHERSWQDARCYFSVRSEQLEITEEN